ncbi:MAG: pyridoxal-phosphate dependent enzyme, partial [Anaerolineales bacterium]|nr:pyridoxal-phosphate dependent enzyme [Anaerolineales bacterium]
QRLRHRSQSADSFDSNFGVETEASNDWWQSFQRNERVKIPPPDTIADGMRTQQPGELTFPVVREAGTQILLVSDAQVIEAMKFCYYG